MKDASFWTYPLVFLSVIVPYLAASLWINTAKSTKNTERMALPSFYRMSWRFIEAIAQSLGPSFAVDHQQKAIKYTKMALMSGYQLTAEHIYAAQVFASLSGAIFMGIGFFVLSGEPLNSIWLALVGAFLGWVYPTMIVEKQAQDRQKEIIKSLPFAIDLLASAMRAGLDFIAAVRYYVTMGGKGALAVEFGLLLRQMELGKSRMEALEEMATHVQTPEFTAFVGAVAHGTEIGASIIDTLQIQGEDMRRARFNLAEQKAARAPSIMIFPIAFFILPAVFTIVLVPVFLRFKAAKGG